MPIRKKMAKNGITQQALAKEIGIGFVTLNIWLSKELSVPHKDKINDGINSLIEKQKGK